MDMSLIHVYDDLMRLPYCDSIIARNGGRVFSRANHGVGNSRSAHPLCVENPQLPGSFVGQKAWQREMFHEKCDRTAVVLRKTQSSQSIIGEAIRPPELQVILARWAVLAVAYDRILPVECFPLGPPFQVDTLPGKCAEYAAVRPHVASARDRARAT
jgi:hypothetical protein